MTRDQVEAITELHVDWLRQKGATFADVYFDGDKGPYITSFEDDTGRTVAEYLPVFTTKDVDKWLHDNPTDAETREKDLIDLQEYEATKVDPKN